MLSEQPPFSNLALISDDDQLYQRLGSIGDAMRNLPPMSASATIQPVKSAPLTQAMRFGFPYSGKLKFATESRSPTI
jgi:hypothetical protein